MHHFIYTALLSDFSPKKNRRKKKTIKNLFVTETLKFKHTEKLATDLKILFDLTLLEFHPLVVIPEHLHQPMYSYC